MIVELMKGSNQMGVLTWIWVMLDVKGLRMHIEELVEQTYNNIDQGAFRNFQPGHITMTIEKESWEYVYALINL